MVHPQLVADGGVEERRVGHENQAGPTLPEIARRLLRHRDVLVRNCAEIGGEQVQGVHGLDRGLVHQSGGIEPARGDAELSRGLWIALQQDLKFSQLVAHLLVGIDGHFVVAGALRFGLVLSVVEPGHRVGDLGFPFGHRQLALLHASSGACRWPPACSLWANETAGDIGRDRQRSRPALEIFGYQDSRAPRRSCRCRR